MTISSDCKCHGNSSFFAAPRRARDANALLVWSLLFGDLPEETTDTSTLASVWRVSFVTTTSFLQMRRGRNIPFGPSKRIFPPSLKQKRRDLCVAEQDVTIFFSRLEGLAAAPRQGR